MKLFYCYSVAIFTTFTLLSNVASSTTTTTTSKEGEECTAASKFKAPNSNTPSDLVAKWSKHDEILWKYIEDQVPAVLDHTGSAAFDEHLRGVQAVLRYWDAPREYLSNAGLLHSIYGTEGFQGFALPLRERKEIQKMIGMKAEKLCFCFCMVDRLTFDITVMDYNNATKATPTEEKQEEVYKLYARPELGRFPILMDKEEWLDFVELTLADFLEQVEGAATKANPVFLWKEGEAYSYRRLAYRKMAEILFVERNLEIPRQMLKAVMSMEDPKTRHLVQVRTPPMSKASADALDALRSIGEDIPEDLSPQPMIDEKDILDYTAEIA